jgi:hypothetical protein
VRGHLRVSDLGEADFCQWLTREIGVAAIPLSAFYGDGFDQRVVRFCFAKKDETLQAALDRLARLCHRPAEGLHRKASGLGPDVVEVLEAPLLLVLHGHDLLAAAGDSPDPAPGA